MKTPDIIKELVDMVGRDSTQTEAEKCLATIRKIRAKLKENDETEEK